MARDHARVKVGILNDPDFRALTDAEQNLYLRALIHPLTSNAGVVPYTARRWSLYAKGSTPAAVRRTIASLEAKRYIVVDEDTEELLVRTFVRHDGLIFQPNVATSMATAFDAILSERIRFAFLAELHRLFHSGDAATARGWEQPKVSTLLAEPFPEGLPEGFRQPFIEGLRQPLMKPPSCVCARTYAAPAPAPLSTPAPGLCPHGFAEAWTCPLCRRGLVAVGEA
jgi:hypothetical protein